MYVFYTLAAGLALLALLLRLYAPYFLRDLRYVSKSLNIGIQLAGYRRSKPCYTILDRFLHWVKARPHKTFLVCGEERYSFAEADRRSNRVARALWRHTLLKDGDTVALFATNEPDFVWTWLGLAKLGCVVALLNTNIRTKSLLHCFSCVGAKVLVASPDLKDAVVEVLPTLREQNISVFLLAEKCDTEGMESLYDKMEQASDEPLSTAFRSKITIKSPALYIYTSGTTGLPKAAMINHEKVWLASYLQYLAGVTSDDVIYIFLPLYHSAGFLMGLTGGIQNGITVALRKKFSASQFWVDCRKYNVTVIQYIGEIIRYLCSQPQKNSDRDHNVRIALGNGIRADSWSEFLQRFGDIRVCECYGATEGNIGFVNYIGKIGALGRENFVIKRLCPHALIKYDAELEQPVRDSNGFCVEVPRGETGLLVVKITNRTPFHGYSRNKEQTENKKLKDVFKKGDVYFNSGDLLKIDHDGFIYFQDRIGDTFRWKGENVATNEVTDILIMVNSIEEANVYGVKVPGHEGRIGMAALKLKEGEQFDPEDTFQFLKTYLPSYARPRFLRIQSSLAVTGTFKQLKKTLVEEGYNPGVVQEPLYFLEENKDCYVPLTPILYDSISKGKIRL